MAVILLWGTFSLSANLRGLPMKNADLCVSSVRRWKGSSCLASPISFSSKCQTQRNLYFSSL